MTRGRLLILVSFVALVVAVVSAVLFANRKLTDYIESDSFRRELDKQTSKGLHFEGQYQAIRRTGLLTVETDGFHSTQRRKSVQNTLDGRGDAKFDPWGIATVGARRHPHPFGQSGDPDLRAQA